MLMNNAADKAVVSFSETRILVRAPYSMVEISRSIPGGKWDGVGKAWVFPIEPHAASNIVNAFRDNSVTLYYAGQAAKDRMASLISQIVQAELVRNSAPDDLPDIPNTKMKPWGHQKIGYNMIVTQPATYLIWEMGCITGDAQVTINRGGKSFKISLAELHRMFNGGRCGGSKRLWDKSITTYIRGMKGDEFGKIKVEAVIDKGGKPVYLLKTKSGKSIKATSDHEFLRGDGRWTPLAELRPMDSIAVNGNRVDKDGYVRVHGVRHPRKTTGGVYEHILVAEKKLGRRIRKSERVHHINGVRHDNRPENLEVISESQHGKEHRRHRNFKEKVIVKYEQIESIKPAGVERVYDVSCESPNNNFVANGIVVHNCGKTMPVVSYICNHRPKLTIIFGPLAVVPVWPREFVKHGSSPVHCIPLHQVSIEKRIERAEMGMRAAAAEGVPCVIVANYEAMQYKAFADWVNSRFWDLAVCDEIHRIKTASGVTSKAIAKTGRRSKKRIGLTGTPMSKPLDVFGQMRFLEPSIHGESYMRFRDEYAIMGGFNNKEIKGYRNMEKFSRKLFSIAHRITAKEALPFLPGFRFEPRIVELTAAGRKVYNTMKREMIVKIGNGEVTASNALAKMLRLQQITSGYLVTEEIVEGGQAIKERRERVDDAKRKALEEELSDDNIETEPVVVFCRFVQDLQEVREAAEKCGRRYLELSGARKEWEEWQYNCAGNEVIGVQIQSGGAGVDLTRARINIDYSVGLSLIDYLQSRKRTLRPGQKRDVTYIQFIAAGTVDERILAGMSHAAEVAENVLQKGGELPMVNDEEILQAVFNDLRTESKKEEGALGALKNS